jgi:DNA-directed RNA polymerase subunit delta
MRIAWCEDIAHVIPSNSHAFGDSFAEYDDGYPNSGAYNGPDDEDDELEDLDDDDDELDFDDEDDDDEDFDDEDDDDLDFDDEDEEDEEFDDEDLDDDDDDRY